MRIRTLLAATFVLCAVPAAAHAQSLASGAPADTFEFTTFASGLGQVTDLRFTPDGRMIAIAKTGEVRVRKTDGTIVSAGSFSVDTESEKGLLGVEVHPDFATNKTLFFYYSASNGSGGTDLDRHRVVSIVLKDDDTLDKATEKVLVKDLRGPANHDGGALSIGKDGKLYIGVGDTGCNKSPAPPSPPGNYFPTCLTNGNGKILRVNLDGTIPSDNPLVGVAAVTRCGDSCGAAPVGTGAPRTDIWAWGFRNPFRIWSDPVSGNLWVGDVGEGDWEEVTVAQKGKHHGWPWREGAHGWPATKCTETVPNTGNCVDPVHEDEHDSKVQSITGGLIMDTCTWPESFRGLYFYADNETGAMWTVQPNAARDGVVAGSQKDFGTVNSAVSLRDGPDGALYVASLGPGRIIRFAPKSPVPCAEPPDAGPGDASVGDASTPVDSGPATDAGTGDDASTNPSAQPSTGDDGGCGCEVPGASRSAASRHAMLALALSGLVLVTRARRRR